MPNGTGRRYPVQEINSTVNQSLSATPNRTTGKYMFGRIGRERIGHLTCFVSTDGNSFEKSSERVIQRDGITLTECVNRRAHATESKTCCASNELPGGKRFPQTGSDDADRNEDDSGDDHRRRQKERDGPQT